MNASGATELDRVRAIERDRAAATAITHVQVVGAALLLFSSFVVGHLLGPVPIRGVEVALGLSATFLLGLAIARPFARRRRDRGARARFVVREGRSKRTVLVYADCVLIDGEPVLRDSVQRLERSDEGLVLRYQDPVAGGPLLRELEGSRRSLDAISDALTTPPAAG